MNAILCVLSLLASEPVSINANSSVAVVLHGVGPGADKVAAYAEQAVRDILSSRGQHVVHIDDVLGQHEVGKINQEFAAAQEAYQKGRKSYDDLDLDVAIRYLHSALEKYTKYPGYLRDFQKLPDILMLLGATYMLRGDQILGHKFLERAAIINPQIEPDPRIFNVTMRRMFNDLLKKLNARPLGSLNIVSTPNYAQAYLDGHFIGITPLSLHQVVQGQHFLRFQKDGMHVSGQWIEVTGAEPLKVNATLDPTTLFGTFQTLLDNISRRHKITDMTDLAALLNTEQVLFADIKPSGERVDVVAVLYTNHNNIPHQTKSSYAFAYPRDTPVDIQTYEHEMTLMLEHMFDPNQRVNITDGPMNRCVLNLPCKSLKNVVVWGGLGLGAVSFGTSLFYAHQAQKDHSQWQSTPQVSSNSQTLSSSGESAALFSRVIFGVGSALLLGSATAFTFWHIPDVSENASETAIFVERHF